MAEQPVILDDLKQMLTTAKIALADLMGDAEILKAIKTNGDDTVTAYERAARYQDAISASKAFFAKAHADEVRHRAWSETTAKGLWSALVNGGATRPASR